MQLLLALFKQHGDRLPQSDPELGDNLEGGHISPLDFEQDAPLSLPLQSSDAKEDIVIEIKITEAEQEIEKLQIPDIRQEIAHSQTPDTKQEIAQLQNSLKAAQLQTSDTKQDTIARHQSADITEDAFGATLQTSEGFENETAVDIGKNIEDAISPSKFEVSTDTIIDDKNETFDSDDVDDNQEVGSFGDLLENKLSASVGSFGDVGDIDECSDADGDADGISRRGSLLLDYDVYGDKDGVIDVDDYAISTFSNPALNNGSRSSAK